MVKRNMLTRLGMISVPILLIILWQLGSFLIGEFALPSPAQTFQALKDGFIGRGWLLHNLQDTLIEVALGYLWAVVFGLIIGFLLGMHSFAREVFEPFVLNIYTIPKVTLFPIFLFIFKLGMESKIAFGMFHGVFPVIILTMGAIKAIKEVYLKVGKSLRLNSFQMFKGIIFPSILPSLMTGLRLGFNLTFLGVILGEMVASRSGLGYMLMQSELAFYMVKILAIILTLAVIAIIVNTAFYMAERRLGKEEAVIVIGR